jgi:hypothetical protein
LIERVKNGKPIRAGGEINTREGADKKRKTAIIIAIGAVILTGIGCVLVNNPKAFGVGSRGILLILAGMWLLPKFIDRPLTRLKKQERQYPQGLKGEEIPKLARIFTIVDQWDALRTKRVYRPAWTRKKTIDYLKENEGKIFDPQITEVFLQRSFTKYRVQRT